MIRGEVGCLRFRFGERPAPSRLIVARIRAVFITPVTLGDVRRRAARWAVVVAERRNG